MDDIRQNVYEFDDDDDYDFSPKGILVVIVHLLTLITIGRLCCGCCRVELSLGAAERGQLEEVDVSKLQPRKRVFTSYLLWICGIIFPMHHFYLDRLLHGMLATWTLNFCFLGWVLDGFMIPRYVRSYNRERCADFAEYDSSRRALLCKFPLLWLCTIGLMGAGIVYFPTMLHHLNVVDIDRVAAQTEVNPYELLGLSRYASAQEAKAAYRKESLRWHPDRNPGCGKECDDKMSEIGKAFELIKRRKAPPPPDRSWEGWLQAVGQDWQAVLQALQQKAGSE
eukprot:gb/GFBE01005115.1/.p1 GENE.gb/GFBE01005115.1/~~gb/GFBE01005115.1/.p1  ORF type:complete len:281 (+),score=54.74 gb/GFBE01005115.1/:1-843(+)